MEKQGQQKYQLTLQNNVANIYKELGDVDLLFNHLENSPNPVLITNRLGTIVYVNEKILEISQYKREELIGNTPSVFKSGAQPDDFYKRLWNAIEKGED